MSTKRTEWTTETVKAWCLEQGMEFLDDTYINNSYKHHFKCTCGNTFERKFNQVKNRNQTRCSTCSNKKTWTIETVKAWCKEQGMEFLSDTYSGNHKKYLFKCACGNTFERSFSGVYNLNQIQCLDCSKKKPWTLETVKQRCVELGIEFLDDTYQGNSKKYHFKCACGNTFERVFKNVNTQGQIRCSTCGINRTWTLETVTEKCKELGVEFLDDVFNGVQEKHHFQCACGNTFERSFSDVNKNNRTHCLDCSTRNTWTEESINEKCKELGVKFLSETFGVVQDKYKFECACGNTFERRFSAVIKGRTHCSDCSSLNMWTLETAKQRCEELGIEFLDDVYYGGKTKHQFKCACGNTFKRTFSNVHMGSTSCYDCSNTTRWTVETIHLRCKELNVEFLDNTYDGYHEKYHFKCACGNIFERSFGNLHVGSACCPECSNQKQWTVEEIQIRCKELGIEFLSDTFYGTKKKYLFQCSCGNTFERSFNRVHQGCIQCLDCGTDSKGEKRIARFFTEHEFSYEREVTFDGLRGRKHPLRFDFSITVNDQLLLVEYDGIQHFEEIEYFGEKAFEITQKNDKKKNEYCRKNNIPLLRIPYYEFDRIEELLTEFIKKY